MAKTAWWICPNCGHHNVPHPWRGAKVTGSQPANPPDHSACEQCGADQASGLDYLPQGVVKHG